MKISQSRWNMMTPRNLQGWANEKKHACEGVHVGRGKRMDCLHLREASRGRTNTHLVICAVPVASLAIPSVPSRLLLVLVLPLLSMLLSARLRPLAWLLRL